MYLWLSESIIYNVAYLWDEILGSHGDVYEDYYYLQGVEPWWCSL
jgi:hypothetical protein